MTGSESEGGVANRDDPTIDTGESQRPRLWREGAGSGHGASRDAISASAAQGESSPILWKWWLLAAVLSLGLWAGIVALIT
jgi:hypothetical protein